MNASAPRRWFAAIALVALGALPACSDQAPTSGTATVSLTTPNSDDGAMLVDLTGPGVRDVEPASFAYKVYWRVVSNNQLRLLIVGDLSAGVIATVTVDKVNDLDLYSATLLEVASRGDVVRSSLAGYQVRVVH